MQIQDKLNLFDINKNGFGSPRQAIVESIDGDRITVSCSDPLLPCSKIVVENNDFYTGCQVIAFLCGDPAMMTLTPDDEAGAMLQENMEKLRELLAAV